MVVLGQVGLHVSAGTLALSLLAWGVLNLALSALVIAGVAFFITLRGDDPMLVLVV